ncbi:MAG TPA: hypothetical protein VK929_08855, partial [Longimicrobiales bacterium]|nr:hypothetical protein [Longimicrobiales bacterium]
SRSDLDAVASLAGRFLADVTSGRYDAVELTDDGLVYAVADGVAAPVVSGGDEDLIALVLRLATMMVSAAAMPGPAFMIVDEPFGTMDDEREGRVFELFRKLAGERGQVIIATRRENAETWSDGVVALGT